MIEFYNGVHCWLELVRNSKKCSNKPNIFLIPLSISELTTSQNFFVTVWPPGGAIITFAENWNFELNFFFGESSHANNRVYMVLDSKKPKNDSETAKNCQSVDTVTHLEQ